MLKECGPFDWVGVSPRMVQHMVLDDFQDLQDPLKLEFTGKGGKHVKHKLYSRMLESYGLRDAEMFQHVPGDGDVHEAIKRRVGRWRALVKSGKPIIFIIFVPAADGRIACTLRPAALHF